MQTNGKVCIQITEAIGTSRGIAPPVHKIGRRGVFVFHKRLGGTREALEDFWEIRISLLP
jgi:hypothetical protein